jgi:ABC-type multidrug transport system ATPase subunit
MSVSAVATTDQPRLVLAGVSKQWRKGDAPLFHEIHLELPPATLTVIVGPNGAGKTTLLRIAAGIITADGGLVELDGLSPGRDRREYQSKLGFLSAGSTGLYARLTVAQHLGYWARLALMPAADRQAKIDAALARFELGDIATKRAARLSMGQRQRLTLALAFLHGPSLVLFDEPWNSLDGRGVELMNTVVTEFSARGGSGLFCTPSGHGLENVPADRVYSLANGALTSV